MRKKIYGQSRVDKCPFCDKQALTKNKQGVPVCADHKTSILKDMKCTCGSTLDIKHGKYGFFFVCFQCGPQNTRRVFELNS
ncbi:hypothetical protein K9M79_00955 [Candidatus Woesearchaeota archaeon]|nr:hypothetical protein [Candidatus Woesearchaeota archaeon]